MRSILRQLIWLWSLSLLFTRSAALALSEEAYEKDAEKRHQLSRRNAPSETSATVLYPQNVSNTPLEVFTRILNVQPNPDPDVIRSLVSFDATYVSLTFDNPVLHQIMPWAGTRYRVGPQAFLDTFTRVGLWWQRGPFQVQTIFGDGGNVTAWGSFTVTSTVMNKTITAPWSARAEVNSEGLITYFQYMEDTFTTSSSFWDQGSKEYTADPFGGSGSGFIAAHVLEILLERGHSVVTTVRSLQKAQAIKEAHPKFNQHMLDFAIVEDIAQPDAFDQAVISDPPFGAVIHTASPYHFNATDVKKELLDPAIMGTTGILRAIKKSAPTVKRVVITSSFAAVVDRSKTVGKIYSEADWNPMTEAEAYDGPANGYRASKTFAERAAWDFVAQEKPKFTLTVCNPPLVLGPIVHYLNSLSALNTSNQRTRDLMTGAAKKSCPPTMNYLFVDVRDLALAHVLAAEKDEAGGQRFLVAGGKFCNKEIAEIIEEEFPELKDNLPTGDALQPGVYPEKGTYGFDNARSKDVLGLTYRPLRESIVDTVKSLQAVAAH